jgi:predicted esterase YcpF (UPF0227 family)
MDTILQLQFILNNQNDNGTKMNIAYIHGFGSNFDATSPKVLALKQLGSVIGFDIDYTLPYKTIVELITSNVIKEGVELLVGTSMGGFFSANCGAELNLPFVCLNPVIHPKQTLAKYIGSHIDYNDKPYTLLEAVVNDYPNSISTDGCGLILLEKGDTLLDAIYSEQFLSPFYTTILSENGSHRFEGLEDKLPEIESFFTQIKNLASTNDF